MSAPERFHKFLAEDLQVGTGPGARPATASPGHDTLSGTKIGIHTLAVGGTGVEVPWDPGPIAPGDMAHVTVTVPGAAVRDFVLRSFSADLSLKGLTLDAEVKAPNKIIAVLTNLTDSEVRPPAGTLRVAVLKCTVPAGG
jgi:hypothetical protein